MDFFDDEEFIDQYDNEPGGSSLDLGESESPLDPFNLNDPTSSYLFLSDDAQDEIEGSRKRKVKKSLESDYLRPCAVDFYT